jgi:1-acyl-sn-glycerol-3-phosphate acyltransferase
MPHVARTVRCSTVTDRKRIAASRPNLYSGTRDAGAVRMTGPSKPHPIVAAVARALLAPEERARLGRLGFDDAGHGYDRFGLSPEWVAMGAGLARPFYDSYFRVSSNGAPNIPGKGPTIVVANHSGSLPIDAAMLWLDIIRHTHPPRAPRPVMDHFVPLMPLINVVFARIGGIGGSRGNVEHLLRSGELLMIFPEGVSGIAKNFAQRYQLQDWRVGHAELAIRHRATVVPAAIIGPEEQLLQVGKTRLGASLVHAPFIPLTLSPVPLPVRYYIHYGEPIALHERHPDPDDPAALQLAAEETKEAVEALIARGLAERTGVFS